MKIKEGFILKNIADSYIVVAVGAAAKSFNGIINLNETGAFLWKKISECKDENELASALTAEYDVDDQTALKDASEFIARLKEAGVLL